MDKMQQCAQASHQELVDGARRHYDMLWRHASHWSSSIGHALDAWEREPQLVAALQLAITHIDGQATKFSEREPVAVLYQLRQVLAEAGHGQRPDQPRELEVEAADDGEHDAQDQHDDGEHGA